MPITPDQARDLVGLAAGRNPSWRTQSPVVAGQVVPLPDVADMVDVTNSVKGKVRVGLRRQPYQLAEITVTADAATTYTVTVNGTAYTGTGADVDAILDAILADMGSAFADDEEDDSQSIIAEVDGATATVLTLRGNPAHADGGDAFTVAVSAASGAGTITANAEASYAVVELYVLEAGLPDELNVPARYTFSDGSTSIDVGGAGWPENVETSGLVGLFLRVIDTDAQGTMGVIPAIAPCVRDSGATDGV